MAKTILRQEVNQRQLLAEAKAVATLLKRRNKKLVLSESCTGGFVAATLAKVPGVSEFFCGSFVVYRDLSKQSWLGISSEKLKKRGAVSRLIAAEMAKAALQRTPEANLAFSITGHLGPTAKLRDEGQVFVACAARRKSGAPTLRVRYFLLLPHAQPLAPKAQLQLRLKRQLLASHVVLTMVRSLLS